MVKLEKKLVKDSYKDYDIVCDNKIVGLLQTVEDDRDYVFIRQIEIYEEYQHKGYARCIVDNLVEDKGKIRYCIATNSEKAIKFWSKYIFNTKYNVKNIRSEIWEIEK